MHPGSTTSTRTDPTAPIDRHSLTTGGGLLGIYNASTQLAVVRGDHDRNFNAKNAGTEPTAAVDAINGSVQNSSGQYVGNDIVQKNFKIKQPLKVTQFTGNSNSGGLGYAKVGLKHDNKEYAPSGRL